MLIEMWARFFVVAQRSAMCAAGRNDTWRPPLERGTASCSARSSASMFAWVISTPFGGPVDVLLVETPPLLLAGAALAYARAKRARLVLNVADLWPDSAVDCIGWG